MELTQIKNKTIYLVVSQTGSIVSWLLKMVTGAKYNHISVSMEETLSPMYSFARKHTYNPFWGGFVKEYPDRGAFKRFKNTEINVLEVSVTEEQYGQIKAHLERMYENKDKYHYNYRGLFWAYFRKSYRKKHHYYCSEFVRKLLETYGVIPYGYFGEIVKPIDFLALPECRLIYSGKLRDYGKKPPEKPEKGHCPNDCGVLV